MGTLFLLDDQGPFPSMAFLVGSGSESERLGDAWGFQMWVTLAEHCVKNGIAVLLFDKPGVGGSSGDWETQTFDDRATDALSAVRYLQMRKEINPGKVGLIGHSQGGWIAQIAAAKSSEISFIITLAGPYISVYEQILMDREGHLKAHGESPIVRFIHMAAAKAMFKAIIAAARAGVKHYITKIIDHDPRLVLREVTCPVLALFGEKDVLCLPEPSLAVIREHLASTDVTYKVFPDTNHLFWSCHTGSTKEFPQLEKKFVPGFLEQIASWVLAKNKDEIQSSAGSIAAKFPPSDS